MKTVKVQYTVREEFVEQNKANIRKVMAALKENPIEGMLYSSYTLEDDEKTFVHINICKDGETMSKINEVEAFLEFRKALKESGLISPPKASKLQLVAAGFDL